MSEQQSNNQEVKTSTSTGQQNSYSNNSGSRPQRRPFNNSRGGDRNNRKGFVNKKGSRFSKKNTDDAFSDFESRVIEVRRVTRVVKGGKRMRFSALVVVGDKAGRVGYGLKKGQDFQDAVAKATKQAQNNLIKIKLNEDKSISFPTNSKFKACKLMFKPAINGTGLIAGGFLRPVLELAGVENIYSKILTTRNKVVGVQASFEALKVYSI